MTVCAHTALQRHTAGPFIREGHPQRLSYATQIGREYTGLETRGESYACLALPTQAHPCRAWQGAWVTLQPPTDAAVDGGVGDVPQAAHRSPIPSRGFPCKGFASAISELP
jgi:hypothetical protein